MVHRAFLTVLGGGLLLVALNVQLDSALARGSNSASLPQLTPAEMTVALGSTCPALKVTQQTYCGSVTTCQDKPNPADCCVTTNEATCPTVQGWNVGTTGQDTTGTAASPNCPNQASQHYPCNCEGTPKSCVKKSGMPGTCSGGTYSYPNAC